MHERDGFDGLAPGVLQLGSQGGRRQHDLVGVGEGVVRPNPRRWRPHGGMGGEQEQAAQQDQQASGCATGVAANRRPPPLARGVADKGVRVGIRGVAGG